MKKIFKGHSPWGFLSFRHVSAENQEPPRYLTGYMPMKKIHKAASVGDITEVQRMLEFGHVDVNITDRKKRSEGTGWGWPGAGVSEWQAAEPEEMKHHLPGLGLRGMEKGGRGPLSQGCWAFHQTPPHLKPAHLDGWSLGVLHETQSKN